MAHSFESAGGDDIARLRRSYERFVTAPGYVRIDEYLRKDFLCRLCFRMIGADKEFEEHLNNHHNCTLGAYQALDILYALEPRKFWCPFCSDIKTTSAKGGGRTTHIRGHGTSEDIFNRVARNWQNRIDRENVNKK